MTSGWRQAFWIPGTKTWPQPTACKLQFWNTSGQMAQQGRIQPQLPAVIRDFLNPKLPLDVSLDTTLPTRGPRPNSTHQWAGAGPFPQMPVQTSRPASPTGGKTPEARKLRSYSLQSLQMQFRPYPGTRWLLALGWCEESGLRGCIGYLLQRATSTRLRNITHLQHT